VVGFRTIDRAEESGKLSLKEPKTLIFIGGAEGSGTTVLRRLLAAPECCASLGANFVQLPEHPEALSLFTAFVDASGRLWDRRSALVEHEDARREWREAAERIRFSPALSNRTHLVLKRSFPFGVPHGAGSPDLWDAVDLPFRTRIVVTYREPCATVYSAYRRGFDNDLRRLAVMCAEQLTWLSAQVRAIGPDLIRIVSYRSLCEAPDVTLKQLAAFCDIPFDPVIDAARREGMASDTDLRYGRELPQADVDWLERYFDARRRRQWHAVSPETAAIIPSS
jgi:hypothetical protein